MIHFDKIDRAINGILAKDLDYIMRKKVYILSLGSDYTKDELQAWLNIRLDLLNQIKIMIDTNVTISIDTLYNSLDANDKLIVDKIQNGEPFDLSTATDYGKLINIIFYRFAITV